MKNNGSLLYYFGLVVADLLALTIGFAGGFIIRAQSSVGVAHPVEWSTYLIVLVGLLPFWIIIFALLGLYGTTIHERRFAEMGRLFVGAFAGMLFMVFWDYMSLENIFPAKLVPVYSLGIAFTLLVLFRTVIRAVRSWLFGYGIGRTRIVIIGNSQITGELLDSLEEKSSGYQVLAVIGYRGEVPENILYFNHFADFLASSPEDIHSIIQTEVYANEDRNTEILSYAQQNHASYRFVPGNGELFVGNMNVDLFRNSIPVIHVHHTPLFGWGRIYKRLFDIFASTVGIIVFSPIMVLIYLVLMFTGGDPIYTRKRLTRFNNYFKIYKFRSLKHAYNGLDPEQGFAKMGKPELAKEFRANGDYLDNDPRISRFGKFIRKTSLDELPQLFNIIKGDISLVGPRALIAEELNQSKHKDMILSVKPGITGLAVVSGRKDIPFEERRRLDAYYVQNWSFWLDLVIILKTFRAVFGGRGAK